MAAIAQSAGIAKGSVYLSFSSKEEIFVALLEDSFASLLSIIMPSMNSLPPTTHGAAEQFALLYSQAVSQTPDLLPLAGMTSAVLEKNLPVPAMLAFKEGLASGLEAAAIALSQSALALDPAKGIELFLRTWSMTLGLWQALDFPKELRAHLHQQPLNVFDRDFEVELTQAVRAVWIGTLQPVS